MPKYIFCLTRMLLNSHNVFMSACPGEDSLIPTHCSYCEYWEGNIQPDGDEEDISRENDDVEDDEEEDE